MNSIRIFFITVTVTILLWFCSLPQTYSQIGITSSFSTFHQPPDFTNYEIGHTISVGLGYKLSLKRRRVEFSFDGSYLMNRIEDQLFHGIGIEISTLFYIFDMEGDCDCPKLYKENDFFKKAFFVQGILGYDINDMRKIHKNHFSDQFLLGIGTGLDIGITNKLVITPQIQGIYKITRFDNPLNFNYSGLSFRLGLRLGVYLD